MCVLVLIDAGIVVAEILLDLHAIRCESHYFNTINTPYVLTCYDCRRTDLNLHQRTNLDEPYVARPAIVIANLSVRRLPALRQNLLEINFMNNFHSYDIYILRGLEWLPSKLMRRFNVRLVRWRPLRHIRPFPMLKCCSCWQLLICCSLYLTLY